MARLRLIHWHPADARRRATVLRRAGHIVGAGAFRGPDEWRSLRRRPPDALVIDLSRLPMQGRDLGLAVRHAAQTRRVPIVFVDGAPEKVACVRRDLPDATFTPWRAALGAIRRAIAHPVRDPVVPASAMAGYAGTPLPRKLGIKPGGKVALVGAPDGFATTLGRLPDGARLIGPAARSRDLTLWFVRSASVLRRRIDRMTRVADRGGLWIIWPKQGSGIRTDVTQAVVRTTGIAAGLVDFKVCRVDDVWAGLRFSLRK